VSRASLPDTNLCHAATFHVWPAMLGEWAGIVKEIARPCPLLGPAREAERFSKSASIWALCGGRDSTEVDGCDLSPHRPRQPTTQALNLPRAFRILS
jgi:hypothetical protein